MWKYQVTQRWLHPDTCACVIMNEYSLLYEIQDLWCASPRVGVAVISGGGESGV